jgi:histone-lysine N-methyltransferase SETD2
MDTDPSPSDHQQNTPGYDSSEPQAITGAHHSADGNEYDVGFSIRGASSRPGSSQKNHALDASQTATPPTTGSPGAEDPEKVARRQAYSGMSADRMRQLGLFDGAAE